MKKALSYLLIFALTLTVLLCLASCSSSGVSTGSTVPIDFDKKYVYDEDRYYVFKSDNTGYYQCHYVYDDDERGYTLSGRVDFEWRIASDGAVYLFEVEAHYDDDHTEGREIDIITAPIYFSEEFFVYTKDTQVGSYTSRYIKEGSKLQKALED